VAVLEPVTAAVRDKLDAKGFDVIAFEGAESEWSGAFERLLRALGRKS
jgi:hypothetical protein